MLAFAAGLLVALLAVTSYAAADARRELAEARAELADTRAELADARDRIAALESQQREAPTEAATEDDTAGGLQDLLDDLLDGAGSGTDLGGLLGGADAAELAECVGVGDLGGFGGLFGGQTQEQRARDIPAIAAAVEEIRGLEFTDAIEPTFLSPAEVADRIAALLREDLSPEEAQREQRVLAALGAIPEDTDLLQLTEEALRAQVAGFYVPETGELVVRSTSGGAFSASEAMTLAHEVEHALADQAIGLPIEEEPNPGEEDAALAALSVIEGDATLTMQQYATTNLSLMDQLGMLTDPEVLGSQAQLTGLPHHLASSLVFPYLEGLSFACDRYLDGGFEAIDAAYRDPPTTTAQVLFPERYTEREGAVDPPDPGGLEEPWRPKQIRTLGAAELLWLLEAPGGDPGRALDRPRERVAAWAGGELHLWVDGDAAAVGVALSERPGSDPDLCDSVSAWADAAWPEADVTGGEVTLLVVEGRAVAVRCGDGVVHVGLAPDAASAEALAS